MNLKKINKNMIEKKLLVIIPAYNEEKNILNTINNLKKEQNFDYIVINDGSKDQTGIILDNNNIPHIDHEINQGLSSAIRTGMKYALENGYNFCIQVDGDNQHNPSYINYFLEKANDENVIVIGNRYKNNKRGISLKSLAQWYIAFCFKNKTKIKLYDPTNGMRLYGKVFMQEFINNKNLAVEPSTIAFLVKNYHLHIIQLYTEVREREHGESMYNNRVKQIKYILKETHKMFPWNEKWARKKTKEKI